MKACSLCNEVKPIDCFRVRNPVTGKRRSDCIECCSKRDGGYYLKNRMERLEANKAWVDKNRARVNVLVKRWADKNRDRQRAYGSDWAKRNPDKQSVRAAKYRARRHMAMPLWADQNEIRRFYEAARQMTAETGIQHEVDHVVPLGGRTVCGLHVHNNLQVIPMLANRTKSAKFDATRAPA